MSLINKIIHLGPCAEAREWLSTFTNPQEAWDKCERGDWMLWLLGKMAGPPESESRKRLVRTAVACASLAPAIKNPKFEQVRQNCLKTTNDYSEGKVTLADVRKAAYAAADAAAYAAAYAAYAAAYAAYAAAAAADAAKRLDVLRLCAIEVRKVYLEAPIIQK